MSQSSPLCRTKVVTIVGARPQFIKASAISMAFLGCHVQEVLVHTGQHFDANMSDIFFEEMAIPKPTYHLGVGGGLHGAMTGRQLEKIEVVLFEERPDWVLVYGDTNSTMAGALAAAKMHIPVAHVEAGLRSFNRRMPEEINRIVVDHVSTLLFAPTDVAVRNLAAEGVAGDRVHQVGDVMLDATLHFRSRAYPPSWFGELDMPAEFVLCTIHRAENTDDLGRLAGILAGLQASGMPVVLPLHPRTRQAMAVAGIEAPANVRVVLPVGYLEMMWLEMQCGVIATDSGGVQKEAYFHKKPCVTLRDETEWVELVDAGVNVLAGSDPMRIKSALERSRSFPVVDGLYGDGQTAKRIAGLLSSSSSLIGRV